MHQVFGCTPASNNSRFFDESHGFSVANEMRSFSAIHECDLERLGQHILSREHIVKPAAILKMTAAEPLTGQQHFVSPRASDDSSKGRVMTLPGVNP